MSTALLDYAMAHEKTVIQKYLEVGHTQMECDSVHSTIECRLKNRDIFLPKKYAEGTKNARHSPMPYEAVFLNYQFFKNFSIQENQRYSSIRPGKKAGDPTVTDLRALKYNSLGEILFKLLHTEEWKNLPRSPRDLSTQIFPQLYNERLPITQKKWKDLQSLKPVIPGVHHSFYDEIPHT